MKQPHSSDSMRGYLQTSSTTQTALRQLPSPQVTIPVNIPTIPCTLHDVQPSPQPPGLCLCPRVQIMS